MCDSSKTFPIPLVVVEGFLGGAGPTLWAKFEEYTNLDVATHDKEQKREVIVASVGPVSSLHDRACELYYALIGGTVDYGEQHAHDNKHGRYGRTHERGLYPQWSRTRPLHFLGHSMGGPTITRMLWLMSTGFFGESAHPDMVLSVTAISAPFRGSQAVYLLGESVDAAPSVRPFSIGSLLAKGVHLASYLEPLLPCPDLHAESRSLSCHESSFSLFLKCLWRSDWAESRDAAPFDVTFQACEEREARLEGAPNEGTFYRSYAVCMTDASLSDGPSHSRILHRVCAWPLHTLSPLISSFDLSEIAPQPSSKMFGCQSRDGMSLSEDQNSPLRANDGLVPLFSQWHPLGCSSTKCRHGVFDDRTTDAQAQVPQPGVWDVLHVEGANHLSFAPVWFGTARQQAFWQDIGRWLWSVDSTRDIESRPGEANI